jgi:DUF4097 and DUF4098 domain-containing protein YvlB
MTMRSNRTKNLIAILIWLFIGSIGAYFFYSAAQNGGINFDPVYTGEPTNILSDVTLDQDIDSVTIEWIAGGVKIIPTIDSKVRIVEKSYQIIDKDKEVKLTVNGSSLNLKTRNKSTFYFFGFANTGTFLEVYLPITTSFKLIKLNSVSGDYSIEEVYSDLTQISLVSGDLNLRNISSSVMSLSLTSGDVTITDSEFLSSTIEMTSGELDFSAQSSSFSANMTSGDAIINLLNELPTTLNIDVTSGDVELTLHGSNPFSFKVEQLSGDFNTHFSTIKNGHVYSYLTGGPTYTIDMTSGNVDVNLITN